MTFIKILITNSSESIFFFYAEVDEQYYEKRKIEIVNNDLLGYANEDFSYSGTIVDKDPLLSIQELNELPGTQAWEIQQEEFEYYWEKAISLANLS